MNPDHQQAQIIRYDFKSMWHWIATSSSVSSKERPSVQHSLVFKYTTIFQLFDDLHSVLIIIKIFMVWSLSYSAWNTIVVRWVIFIYSHSRWFHLQSIKQEHTDENLPLHTDPSVSPPHFEFGCAFPPVLLYCSYNLYLKEEVE